jgi:chromosome segregation ATPase
VTHTEGLAVRTDFRTSHTTEFVSPAQAGRIMLGIAALGLVVSLVGTVLGWQLMNDLHSGARQSLELTASVLETVDESFVIAEGSLDIVIDAVDEAESAIRALGRSMAAGEDALVSATDLTGGEIADALESVEASLPTIRSAAEAIDTTLGALSSLPFGPTYDAEQPLGPSIGQLQEDLSGLPDDLRDQAAQVEEVTRELAAATEGTVATADSLAALDSRLRAASTLLGDYGVRTAEARELVAEQQDTLATSATRARLLVVALGLVFAVSQFVPLYLGLSLLDRPAALAREL